MESADFSCLRDASLSRRKLELSKEMKDLDMQIEDSHAPRPPRSTHRYETHSPPPKKQAKRSETLSDSMLPACVWKSSRSYVASILF
jgi:hypothetical protein